MIADANALLRRAGTRQLVKFCFVGASSTLIDKGTLWLLLSVTPRTPWWISASMSFCLAVTNGFVWNRRWTFRARRHGSLRAQYAMFVATNLVGLMLNLGLTKLFLILFTGQLRHIGGDPKAVQGPIAPLAGVRVVTRWGVAAAHIRPFPPTASAVRAGRRAAA